MGGQVSYDHSTNRDSHCRHCDFQWSAYVPDEYAHCTIHRSPRQHFNASTVAPCTLDVPVFHRNRSLLIYLFWCIHPTPDTSALSIAVCGHHYCYSLPDILYARYISLRPTLSRFSRTNLPAHLSRSPPARTPLPSDVGLAEETRSCHH